MVDKVNVNPLEVRGAGDIVSPKTASDFDVYNSTIVSSSEDVDGATMTVYTVSYVSGTYFTVSSESIVPVGEASFTVSAVLKKNSDDSAVSGASVSCTVNGETVLTGTTDSNGSVSFTIPTMEDVGKYTVKLVYSGTGSVGGAFKVTGLICVDLTTLALALTGDKTIIQTGDSCVLLATLTGTGVDGELIGVPGQTVELFEEYTPALDITVSQSVIQSGDNTSIILQLKDEEDGSLVRESGLTIDLYSNVTVFKSFTLTSDKDVLSAYDSESAVLTATYLEDNVGVSGKSVVFKNGDTVLDTVVTDSNGEAKYTYASQGVGDVIITAECMNVSEIYAIEDCLKVGFNGWTGTYTTGTDTYDYITPTGSGVSPNVALPTNFKVNYKIYCTRYDNDGGGSGLWVIGTDTNNGVLIGHEVSDTRMRIYSRSGGNNTAQATENNVYSYQSWADVEIIKNNGSISIKIGGKTISYSLSNASIMQLYYSYIYLRIAEWKVKPL